MRGTSSGLRLGNDEGIIDSDCRDDGGYKRGRMRNVRRCIDLYAEDSSITQNGCSQWREVLLYNSGAVALPEGNGDEMDEFDHAWQNILST